MQLLCTKLKDVIIAILGVLIHFYPKGWWWDKKKISQRCTLFRVWR